MEALSLRETEVCVPEPDLHHEPGNALHRPLAGLCRCNIMKNIEVKRYKRVEQERSAYIGCGV